MPQPAGDPVAPEQDNDVVAPSADAALTAALARAQAAFPVIHKGNTATVTPKGGGASYSYTYADLGDVLTAVRPVLAEHGLAIVQRTVRGANGVLLITELRHVAGGSIESEVDLGQSSSNPQQFGGALTYLRRYELVTLLGIAAEDDNDAQHVEPRNGNTAPPAPPAWTMPAAKENVQANLKAVAAIIGQARAVELAHSIREKCDGEIPNAVAFALGSFALTAVDELDPLALEAAAEKRAAAATAAAQDASAENPDPPAPEPAGEEGGSNGAPAEVLEAEADQPPPAEPVSIDAAPGTIPKPTDIPQDPAKAIGTYRALGCTCQTPVTAGVSTPADDACPIVGHGIPF